MNPHRGRDLPGGSGPRISLLTTVYRTEEFLVDMIDSVIAQTCPDWELIIVDNGGSQTVVDIVGRYAGDARIRLVRQENRGYRGGVTAAAEAATGEFLSVLDSDDQIMPDFVLSMSQFAALNPSVDAIGCDAVQFDEESQVHLKVGYLESVSVEWNPRFLRQGLTLRDVLSGVVPYYTGAVRREAWHAVGGYAAADEDVDESVAIWIQLVRKYDVRLMDLKLGWYRLRRNSLSHDPNKIEGFERSLMLTFTRAAESLDSQRDRRAVHATLSRIRFHQELRKARGALLEGDSARARRHARRAFTLRPGPRSFLVVTSVTVAPGLMRRVHPLKAYATRALLRWRERWVRPTRA